MRPAKYHIPLLDAGSDVKISLLLMRFPGLVAEAECV